MNEQTAKEPSWWQTAVFYQVYPRSFFDSRGDGVGDLPGIIAKLDYLCDLGVDAIWLSPHYTSPQFDIGYDIADFTGVAAEYGTVADFRRLLAGLHARGMRLILDLVLNHTSDHHPWFLRSRSGRQDPYRDWYIWKEGRDGGPPNNWHSAFGGPAWEYDPLTGQYYYHYFFKQQPDLNWRNPDVQEAMFAAARTWLDLGVDGFRLDAISTLYEHPDFPNQPVDESLARLRQEFLEVGDDEARARVQAKFDAMFQYQRDLPEVHQVFRDLRSLVDEYGDCVLVGEHDSLEFLGRGDDELHMVFNFPLLRAARLTPAVVRRNQSERLAAHAQVSSHAWPCNTLGNHDSPRVFRRFGDPAYPEEWARLSLALMLTLRGTPFLYNGEEIGMTDLLLEDPSQFRDILSNWLYEAEVQQFGIQPTLAALDAARFGRDKCRTPLQWSSAPNAGFSPPGVRTWLPVHPNHGNGVNVADQDGDPGSLLNFYRRFLRLRRSTPALQLGDYAQIAPHHPHVLAFLRSLPTQTCLVALNMSPKPQTLDLSRLHLTGLQPLFSFPDIRAPFSPSPLSLPPHAILVSELARPEPS